MKTMWAKNKNGFTIVELLIVIVVIGILAAIVSIAYSGVQQRATDVRRVAAIDAVEKSMHIYKAQHGKFPDEYALDPSLTVPATCIGELGDYPARDGFREGECMFFEFNGTHQTHAEIIPALNNVIKTQTGSGRVPDGSYPPIKIEIDSNSAMYSRGVALNAAVNYGQTIQISYYENSANQASCGRGELHDFEVGEGNVIKMCVLEAE